MTTPTIRNNNTSENSLGSLVNEKVTDDAAHIAGNRAGASFSTLSNLNPHPSFQDGTVGPVMVISRFGAPTPMLDEDRGYIRLTATGNSPTARVMRVNQALAGAYTVSAWVRATRDTRIRAAVSGRWAAGTQSRNWQQGGVEATGDWQRVSVTFVLPADGSGADLTLSIDNTEAGGVLDVRDILLTSGVTLWGYFDGDSVGAEWTGAAYESTSVLTLSEVPISLEQELFAITGQTPFVEQIGAGTTGGLSTPVDQPLTIYGVFTAAPASVRARLRSATSPLAERLSVGRNSAGNAWVAVATDAATATHFASIVDAGGPAVAAGVRDATGVTLDVRGVGTESAAISGFDTVDIANVNNTADVAYSLAYEGAHDASMRAAVMDALAAEYGIA